MKRFPEFIRNSMDYTGSSVTCLPVKIDDGNWEAAVFFQVGGRESKQDRRVLSRLTTTVPVMIEMDLIAHASASIVVIRLEVYTRETDPLIGEILLTPGETESHFETMRLLTSQRTLKWFFADGAHWIIHSQQNPLGAAENGAFQEVLDDSTKHDALIRMTGKYDVQAALAEVVSHYEFKSHGMGIAPSSNNIS